MRQNKSQPTKAAIMRRFGAANDDRSLGDKRDQRAANQFVRSRRAQTSSVGPIHRSPNRGTRRAI